MATAHEAPPLFFESRNPRHIDVTSAPPTPIAGSITTPSELVRDGWSFWKYHSGVPFMPG
ncbi:hypothetical protein [Rhizobium sp. BK456]|uniref:hypothetical protein n=1 Tax=Rhizobium sp. BK456 TaxID=2587007 RepID=UPI001616A975|nr:hypothetical protein [Rhizobium sp. BK456]MBB3523104.1 hypothetical protein [Rhizobium sp. BK456]